MYFMRPAQRVDEDGRRLDMQEHRSRVRSPHGVRVTRMDRLLLPLVIKDGRSGRSQ